MIVGERFTRLRIGVRKKFLNVCKGIWTRPRLNAIYTHTLIINIRQILPVEYCRHLSIEGSVATSVRPPTSPE